MSRRDVSARAAAMAALRLRRRHALAPEQAVDPVDLALAEGLDVRFEALKSVEGIYAPDVRAIILGSLRPRGRRAFNCAHELGHHVFGHGFRVDELLAGAVDDEREGDDAEFVANRFAAALLMPKLAVLNAFAVRRWDVAVCTEEQVFTIAGQLGVGYLTLVGYLETTARTIDHATARRLRKTTPKKIRGRILDASAPTGLIVVDEFWTGRPVDAELGDVVLLPAGTEMACALLRPTGDGQTFEAISTGTAQLRRGAWQSQLRVMPANYAGAARYRYLEEAEDE